MFKFIRVLVLLLVLVAVAASEWRARTVTVAWKYTLPVNVFPINGDGSEVAAAYIRGLRVEEFKPVEGFMREAADQYGLSKDAAIEMRLQPALAVQPPMPPANPGALDVALWSLQFRWWAYRYASVDGGPRHQVRLFVRYFDPAKNQVQHSTALQKGLMGLVNVYASADARGANNVIVAHEFLHTLGASDKYDLATQLPTFPDGYGDPAQSPLLPQRFAEIMGGRLVISDDKAEIPHGLHEVVMGRKTAQEINFLPATQP